MLNNFPLQKNKDNLANGGNISGDLTVTGNLKVNEDFNFGDASMDTLTSQGQVIIDADLDEALLVRKDGDAGDVFIADTNNSRIGINTTPSTELDIGGQFQFDTSASSFQMPATASAPAHSEALMYYDSSDDSMVYYNNEADVALNIGRENWVRVRNETGSTISNGDVVRINGAHAGTDSPTVELAQANDQTDARVLGVATHDIENNTLGYVTVEGLVRNLDTSSFSAGDTLFLSASTPGGVTTTEPSSPNFSVVVGTVTQASASNGTISVKVGEERTSIFTQGSVPFADSNGKLVEDNSNLFWDNQDDRLGIGTTSPSSELDVDGKATLGQIRQSTGAATYAALALDSRVTSNDDVNLTFSKNDTLLWDLFTDSSNGDQFVINDKISTAPRFILNENGEAALGGDINRSNLAGAGIYTDGNNVGIGTSNPGEDFANNGNTILGDDVDGSSKITLNGNDVYVDGQLEVGAGKGMYTRNMFMGGLSESSVQGNDGYLATDGKIKLEADSAPIEFGAAQDSSLHFDGTNTVFDYDEQDDGTTGFDLNANGTTALFADSNQNIGIGTASPSSKLDVDGKAAFNDDHTFYGEMSTSSNSTATTISSQNSFTEINVYSGGLTRDITFSSNDLNINTTGTYKFEANFSVQSGDADADVYEIAAFVNGSEKNKVSCKIEAASTGFDNCAAAGLLALNNGDTVDVRVQNTSDSSDITVQESSVMLTQQ